MFVCEHMYCYQSIMLCFVYSTFSSSSFDFTPPFAIFKSYKSVVVGFRLFALWMLDKSKYSSSRASVYLAKYTNVIRQ